MGDLPALRSALHGVSAVVHVFGEWDILPHKSALDHPQDTINLITAMEDVGVQRLIYVSRLGADKASAFPVLRIRGEAEAAIRSSSLAATILQPTLYYGPDDGFVSILAMLCAASPFFVPLPDTGLSRFQPLWIDDLARCVATALLSDGWAGQTIQFGGPEHYTLHQIASEVLQAMGIRRKVIRMRFTLAYWFSSLLDLTPLRNPFPLWMLDLLSAGSTTDLASTSAAFGFEPRRFGDCLGFLQQHKWRHELLRFAFRSDGSD